MIDEMVEQTKSFSTSRSNELVSIDKVKGLNVKGYYLVPEYTEIIRMNVGEAQSVRNFTIGNQYGKIIWEGTTDVLSILNTYEHTFKDLTEVVDIQHSALTVYEDDSKKPPRGEGLNKPAIVYLYELYPKTIEAKMKNYKILTEQEVKIYDSFKEKLRSLVSTSGGVFLSYKGQSGELCFSVPGF